MKSRIVKLRIESDGRVRRIILASPETRNILDAALADSLLHEITAATEDPAIGAILLEADGPMFCGGVDPASPPSPDLFTVGGRTTKPVVVSVKGAAVSAGLALIATAHVAIAAQGCTFGLIDIREGRWNETVFHAVTRAVGHRRALELALTGRIFSTAEAAAWGLIHMVAPAFELDDRAIAVATALANANPDVVRAALSATPGAPQST